MFRNVIGAALISTAMVIAGPAIAGPGGGHGGGAANVGMHAGGMAGPVRPAVNTRVNSQTSLHASPMATAHSGAGSVVRVSSATRTHATPRMHTRVAARTNASLSARANSQGVMHASFRAIERASPKSALARGAVQASVLPGLNTGLTVKGNGGTTIGTVSRVVTGTDGKIRLVVATSPTGRTIRLLPNTLSISGGIVTTTML